MSCKINRHERRDRKRESEIKKAERSKKQPRKRKHHSNRKHRFYGVLKRDLSVIFGRDGVVRVVAGNSREARKDRILRNVTTENDMFFFQAILNFENVDWNKTLIYHFRWEYKSFRLIIGDGNFLIEALHLIHEDVWADLDPELMIPRRGILKIKSREKCRDAYNMTRAYEADVLMRASMKNVTS